MVNKQQIAKITKRIMHPENNLQSPKIMHPARDWGFGILASIVILAGCVAWSAGKYTQYKDVAVAETSNGDTRVTVYRESVVDSALELFRLRQEEYDNLVLESKGRARFNDSELNVPFNTTESLGGEVSSSEGVATTSVEAMPATELGEEKKLKTEDVEEEGVPVEIEEDIVFE